MALFLDDTVFSECGQPEAGLLDRLSLLRWQAEWVGGPDGVADRVGWQQGQIPGDVMDLCSKEGSGLR